MKLAEAFAKRKTYDAWSRREIQSPSLQKARDIFVKLVRDKTLDKYIHDQMEVYTHPHKHKELWDEGGGAPQLSMKDIIDITIDLTKDALADEFLHDIEDIK